MAENLVKNLVCSKCAAEARPGAAFCFACGGEVIAVEEDSGQSAQAPRENGSMSSAWFRGDITAESQKLPPLQAEEPLVTESSVASDAAEVEEIKVEQKGKSGKLKQKNKKTGSLASGKTKPLSTAAQEAEPPQESKVSPLNKDAAINRKAEEIVPSKPETPAQNQQLKSAAAIRQKSKLAEKKRVEVVWAPPEGAPNIWFVAVAIILTVFAVGILVLMMYLR